MTDVNSATEKDLYEKILNKIGTKYGIGTGDYEYEKLQKRLVLCGHRIEFDGTSFEFTKSEFPNDTNFILFCLISIPELAYKFTSFLKDSAIEKVLERGELDSESMKELLRDSLKKALVFVQKNEHRELVKWLIKNEGTEVKKKGKFPINNENGGKSTVGDIWRTAIELLCNVFDMSFYRFKTNICKDEVSNDGKCRLHVIVRNVVRDMRPVFLEPDTLTVGGEDCEENLIRELFDYLRLTEPGYTDREEIGRVCVRVPMTKKVAFKLEHYKWCLHPNQKNKGINLRRLFVGEDILIDLFDCGSESESPNNVGEECIEIREINRFKSVDLYSNRHKVFLACRQCERD